MEWLDIANNLRMINTMRSLLIRKGTWKRSRRLLSIAAVLLSPLTGSLTWETRGEEGAGVQRGAWIDEIVFMREPDTGKAVNLIEGGRLDVFAAGLSNPTIFNRIRESTRVIHDISHGTSAELTINTARFDNERELNPFQSREIRESLNWLIDRDYIANELYGGLAVQRYLPIHTAFPDYARLAVPARALELKYRHDPEKAEDIIHGEMKALGAEMINDIWTYKGKPVELRILIRTDDARELVGDYIGNILEGTGFKVQRMYRNAAESSAIWIGSDPKAGRWHLYTGGWAATMINRDLAGVLDDFYTPRGRPYSLWQTYDPDPELDEIAQQLQRREYDTWDKRQELMATGLELAMRESTRIWLVDTISVWPRATDVDVASDLAAGFGGSYLWPYTIRFTDRTGGRMRIGAPSFLTDSWNPVAGSNWIFDQMIMRGIHDPALLPDPFTGLFRPQRVSEVEVTVQSGVPVILTLDWLELSHEPEIKVPPDAWIDWDSDDNRFINVGEKHPEGLTSRTRTRVVYEKGFFDRVWHDGSSVSPADIILPWILFFERADAESRLFDRSALPSFQSFQRHFKGWNIISHDPLEIEIFSDQIYPDAEWIAGARIPGATAWHMLMIGIMAELNGELAFSSDKADLMGVDWMNMVTGPSLRILDRKLDRAKERGIVLFEETLGEFMEEDEIRNRYEALEKWRIEKGHFMIGSGPFYLQSARPIEGTVVLRRFEQFPDPSDKWLRFTEAAIPVVEIEGPAIVESGDTAEFTIRIMKGDETYPAEDIYSVGFMFFDSRDELIFKGEADQPEENRSWRISLSGEQVRKLDTGANSLEVAVTSRNIALPSFASLPFATVPETQQ